MTISVDRAQTTPQSRRTLGVRNTAILGGLAGAGTALAITKSIAGSGAPARALVLSGVAGAIGGAVAGMWSGALSEEGESGQRIAFWTGMVGAGLLFGFGVNQQWASPIFASAGIAAGTSIGLGANMLVQGIDNLKAEK